MVFGGNIRDLFLSTSSFLLESVHPTHQPVPPSSSAERGWIGSREAIMIGKTDNGSRLCLFVLFTIAPTTPTHLSLRDSYTHPILPSSENGFRTRATNRCGHSAQIRNQLVVLSRGRGSFVCSQWSRLESLFNQHPNRNMWSTCFSMWKRGSFPCVQHVSTTRITNYAKTTTITATISFCNKDQSNLMDL